MKCIHFVLKLKLSLVSMEAGFHHGIKIKKVIATFYFTILTLFSQLANKTFSVSELKETQLRDVNFQFPYK